MYISTNLKSLPVGLSKLIILASLLLLNACTHTLYIDSEFPQPLVKQLPYTVGVYYSPEFTDYKYVENDDDRTKWVIESGVAQERLFNTMLEGMFAKVVPIKKLPPWDSTPAVDLVLAPTVADFQYTLPRETKIKVYEIWMKYNVQVFGKEGELIADWILTSYGKTPTGFMQSDDGALYQAVVVALRDAGAYLVLNFPRMPEMSAWMEQNSVKYSQLPEEDSL